MQRELKLRILSGLVMAAVVLMATVAGGAVFRVLSIAIGVLVYFEWARMAGRGGSLRRPTVLFGWAGIVAVGLCLLLPAFAWGLAGLVIFAVLTFLAPASRSERLWGTGGVVYAGLAMIALAFIRGDGHAGLVTMLFLFAVVWATDIMAYFTGRAIGGPKLAPSISPGKTWSGALGGAIFAVIAGIGVLLAAGAGPGLWVGVMCLALSAVSQAGDLFESRMKRIFGVKDSSHLIPGHGGVMDRVDGLVAAAFILFFMAFAIGGWHSLTDEGGSAGTLLLGVHDDPAIRAGG